MQTITLSPSSIMLKSAIARPASRMRRLLSLFSRTLILSARRCGGMRTEFKAGSVDMGGSVGIGARASTAARLFDADDAVLEGVWFAYTDFNVQHRGKVP